MPQTKQYADIIVPRGMQNKAALKLMVDHIASFLERKDAYVVGEDSGRSVVMGSTHGSASDLLGSKDSEFKMIPK